MKCSQYPKCEYWSFGSSGSKKGRCWVKLNSASVREEPQDNRDSGYYDPCQDDGNVEKHIDFLGSDLIKGGTNTKNTRECCHTCVATVGCKYYSYSTSGSRKGTCWTKSDMSGWEKQ